MVPRVHLTLNQAEEFAQILGATAALTCPDAYQFCIGEPLAFIDVPGKHHCMHEVAVLI